MEFLNQINSASPEEARIIISQASDDNITALTELAVNLLKGNVDISLDTYTKLKAHSDLIRKLAKRSVSVKNKRKWLKTSIDLVPLIVTPFLSCLGSCLVKEVLDKALG